MIPVTVEEGLLLDAATITKRPDCTALGNARATVLLVEDVESCCFTEPPVKSGTKVPLALKVFAEGYVSMNP